MPVKDCQTGGRPGKKYGDTGKCYPCEDDDCSDAAKKAAQQGTAIKSTGWKEAGTEAAKSKYVMDRLAAEDRSIEQIKKRFVKNSKYIKKETDWSSIEGAVGIKEAPEKVLIKIGWQDFDPLDELEDVYVGVGKISAKHIRDIVKAKAFESPLSKKASDWLKEFGASEVKYISESQREAIRDVLARCYVDETHSRMAWQIKSYIGLDPTKAQVLQQYGNDLMAEGLSEKAAWELIQVRGEQLLLDRAELIAKNETLTASRRASYDTVVDAIDQGVLNPDEQEGIWTATLDDRTCPECMLANGSTRELPDGIYDASGTEYTELHIGDRCIETIRSKSKSKETKTEGGDAIPYYKQLSSDYLEKFLELIKGDILPEMWDDVHRHARAYAGGKATARNRLPRQVGESTENDDDGIELSIESIQIGPGIIRREGPYIISPVHLTGEGVVNRGLKRWEEIYDPEGIDGVYSFEGRPITRGHPPGRADEETPTLGKLRNVVVDTETKRAHCEAWLVEKRLTGKEVDALDSGEQVPGSIGYISRKTYLPVPQLWDDGSEYDFEVKKPFMGDHYALLNENEEPGCQICGLNVPKEQMETHLESHNLSECQLKSKSKLENGRNYMVEKTEPVQGSPKPGSDGAQGISKADFEALKKQLVEEKAAREKLQAEAATKEKLSKEAVEKTAKEAIEKASKEAAEAKAEVEKLRAEAKLKVHIETARTDYEAIHKADELGIILLGIETKAPEEYKKLAPILKTANERIKAGDLFKTAGRTGAEVGGTAWEKIEKAAKERKDKNPKMSMTEAIDLVCQEHVDWYAEHRKEVI